MIQGRDFLDVAKKLVRMQSEAALRSAISRAYYALLNSAIEFLTELGFSAQQGPGVHGTVRNRLFNSGTRQAVEFSNALDELRILRNAADYKMSSKAFQDKAICALRVTETEMVLGLLTDCHKEPLRSQIRSGIREYERKIGS